VAVFGGLLALAVVLMAAVVAIGLPGNHRHKPAPVAATSTQPTTTVRTTPTVTEPPARTQTQTTQTTPTDTTPTDTTPTDTTPTDTTSPGAAAPVDECHDGIDNDHDNLIDAAQDDGCLANDTEAPVNRLTATTHAHTPSPPTSSECNDGIDNDGDGLIDSEDPSCPGPTEYPSDAPG
jgi:hypothetical protein